MAKRKSLPSLQLPVSTDTKAWKAVRRCAVELQSVAAFTYTAIEDVRLEFLARASKCGQHSQLARVAITVLCDLRAQGWELRAGVKRIGLERFEPTDRDQVRAAHGIGRDMQLRAPSVRTFVSEMERRRLGPNGWVSIFSLMRDGRELASALDKVVHDGAQSSKAVAFRQVVDPYLEFVEEGALCHETGFRLIDIWRYFRHTWATEYASVPGRTMNVLIRDRAAPGHPVIGIASLSSPVVHLTHRDRWLGWDTQEFLKSISAAPSREWAKWVHSALATIGREIYLDDLIKERVITRASLENPKQKTIDRLHRVAEDARDSHRRYPMAAIHKNPATQLPDSEWQVRAETYLFRWKRASLLASFMEVKLRLAQFDFKTPTIGGLRTALESGEGRHAIDTIRRWVKARHVGNDMLDITVCGAVAPYGELVGGKLVAMLLTSPEVVDAYAKRYSNTQSIIASSIAGRAIRRRPQLVALTTTSLYGGGLNQYTRIAIPADAVGQESGEIVRYERLGETEGQGSFHFSRLSLNEMSVLIRQQTSGPKVHSIFGEGVNPRLRKIRGALELVGFPSDLVLTHGSTRDMYGVRLARNTCDYLLGKQKTPDYILGTDSTDNATSSIADFWISRWALNRVTREEVRERIKKHSLIRPIRHGARVVLPNVPDEGMLFPIESDDAE